MSLSAIAKVSAPSVLDAPMLKNKMLAENSLILRRQRLSVGLS